VKEHRLSDPELANRELTGNSSAINSLYKNIPLIAKDGLLWKVKLRGKLSGVSCSGITLIARQARVN